jgi:hypothetical protein
MLTAPRRPRLPRCPWYRRASHPRAAPNRKVAAAVRGAAPAAAELLLRHGRIAEEVIAHLAGLLGAKVTVTLEIEASMPGGVPENIVRTVTENGRTLGFTNQGFRPRLAKLVFRRDGAVSA